MKLKVTYLRGGDNPSADVVITADTTATVASVADALVARDPLAVGGPAEPTLWIGEGGGRTLDPDSTILDAGLVSGQHISLAERTSWHSDDRGPAAATLTVVRGPASGASFSLRAGSSQVGRSRSDNEVVIDDPQVSKVHLRINVGEQIEVIDLGSSNGTQIDGADVQRAVVKAGDEVVVGDSAFTIVHHHSGGIVASDVLFNRSPRIDDVYVGVEYLAPEPVETFGRPRVPVIPLIAPVLMGCIMFAITQNLVTVVFVALSPIMMVGNVIETRIFGKRDHDRAIEAFYEALASLDARLTAAAGVEATQRRLEHPETAQISAAGMRRERVLWSYRPDARGFLDVRLGLGSMPSRNTVDVQPKRNAVPELTAALDKVIADHAFVDAVPVVASLTECGSLGFAGPRAAVLGSVRAAVAQLTVLHSPSEVVVAAMASSEKAADWAALKWLPHTSSDHSPLGRDTNHLVSGAGGVSALVANLEGLVAARLGDDAPTSTQETPVVPAVVVIVEDDTPVDRSRLVALAEAGRHCGIHLLWIAPIVEGIPAPCRVYLEVDGESSVGAVGFVDGDGRAPGGLLVENVTPETFAADALAAQARALCPFVDAGARLDDDSDLPRTVSLPTLVGVDLLQSPDAVIDHWRTSNSIPAEMRRRRKANHLRSVVGAAAGNSVVLDLREHGPHALVGGTTGSGKSEFLQSWVLGLALEHSPARVTFLFVDYKGGSAFAECVNLPHCVGLVTDLSPQLVQRALTSLNAELHHREELLNRKRKKDLIELEKEGDPDAPPSLIIVVDEFAALAQEVPEFVDGVINVAQRGRSLGLHLVLATQRPAGVITGNLRANTNLRVALRVADEADSDDVVGSRIAAGFDPGIPGRAVAKTGPGRLLPFQSGYVGGHTSEEPPPPSLVIQELTFGLGPVWEPPETDDADRHDEDLGPTDLQRLVANAGLAFEQLELQPPRRPWLDELAPAYDLANLPNPSRDDAVLTFGILDDPARQQQYPVSFHPDADGNMAVIGTGGSGKSTFLRTLGIVAGLGFRGGPCHVYGLDFGARGLAMLEALPHVGSIVNGDDDERVQRTLRMLRDAIDERAARYSKVRAGSIAEYRELADRPDEPRLLLLLDNITAFRAAYELGPLAKTFDRLLSIAADGRQVGVHVAVSADRPNSIPSSLNSVIQRQLVLRLSAENDLLAVGVPGDWFEGSAVPGRGYLEGNHVQVLVLGGNSNTSRQSEAVENLAEQLRSRGDRTPAPPIESLPEVVNLADLPSDVGGRVVIGLGGDDLQPLAVATDDVFLVAGPAQSGRTTAMATLAEAISRTTSGERVYLGPGRSFLVSVTDWDQVAAGEEEVARTAPELAQRIRAGWRPAMILLEDHGSFVNTSADMGLVDLLGVCRAEGVLVVADRETGVMGSWPLQEAVKAGRQGLVLQPDQNDGEQLFKTPLPRVNRSDFPPGRGFYIRAGRAHLVQVAMPV